MLKEHTKTEVLPHSIEAEQSVLGGLMLDNNSWGKIADRIAGSDFYRKDHRIIFEAMSVIINREQPLDTLTLAETLKEQNKLDAAGGEGYLFNLAKNTPSATNIKAYADIVRERSILRQLINLSHAEKFNLQTFLKKRKIEDYEAKRKKFEKIEKMTWDIYRREIINYNSSEISNRPDFFYYFFNSCWEKAEEFYNRAKKKQEGAGDGS